MATRDTRREFDEIVGRLTVDYPSLARPVRRRVPRRLLLHVLAVGGGLLWAGLSVLMVVTGALGVVITCVVVAVAMGVALYADRR